MDQRKPQYRSRGDQRARSRRSAAPTHTPVQDGQSEESVSSRYRTASGRRYQAAAAQRRARRQLVWLGVSTAVLVAVVLVGSAVYAMAARAPLANPDATEQRIEQAFSNEPGQGDAGFVPPADGDGSNGEDAAEGPALSAEEAARLAERDEDFAVDPSRTDWNFETNGEKIVYLTFDDGPSHNTERVLDVLDKYHVRATFFVTNQATDTYGHMIKVAYDRGHTIGLHTSTHDYAQVYASVDAYFQDLDAIASTVKEQIGYVPAFVRFPGGSSNTISASYCKGIMTTLAAELQKRGYQYYDWNVSCGDGADHSAEDIERFACEGGEGFTNIVLLMHDSDPKDTTVEALPHVIEHYRERGYEFRAIDRTSMVPHHGIGN